ncbi:MAG: sigma-70 family RNA polymerase sigma factor [Nanoarchaeota archaeon]
MVVKRFINENLVFYFKNMQNSKNVVIAVGPKEDLEVRLTASVYDREGKLVLQYRADRGHIGKLGDLRGESLQELATSDSNGQDIYSLSLGRNPVRDTLLVRIGDYVVNGIVNRSGNTDNNRSKPKRKKDFYEPDFKKPGFEAEDIHIGDTVTDNSGYGLDDGSLGRKLTPEEEIKLFRRFNWLRYKLMDAQDKLRRDQDKIKYLSGLSSLIDYLEPKISDLRDKITRHNMALVLSMARRTKINAPWEELVSEGNLALSRSVDRFEYTRGFKFSTYACGSIQKAFIKAIVVENRYRSHNPTSFDSTVERSDHLETSRNETEGYYLEQLRRVLNGGEARLNEAESRVIRLRFRLDDENRDENKKGRTLEEVGGILGVSKERVRQVQNMAFEKLKAAIEQRVASY